jgi:type II secretory pathway component PulF
LAEAVAAAGLWLPTDALVAVRVGCETGRLAPSLSRVARADDEVDYLVRSVFEKFVYLGLVIMFLLVMLTFLMLKIVPVFAKMFDEFGLELPKLTALVIACADFVVAYGILFLPLFLLLVAILVVGVLYYVGWLPRDLPLVSRLGIRADSAVVMRTLSMAVTENIALDQMIWTLSRVYPKRSVRNRLMAAGRHINNGRNWCDSLFSAGLIRAADMGVLKSAQRVGNLEWALDEMADSSVRRLAYRLRLMLNVAFPLVLFFFGLMVGFHVIGLFMPLVSLILGLT